MPSVLDRQLLTKAAENIELEGQRYWARARRWAVRGPDVETGDETAYARWDKLRTVANAVRKVAMDAGKPSPPRSRGSSAS